jgi:hypothetical protein
MRGLLSLCFVAASLLFTACASSNNGEQESTTAEDLEETAGMASAPTTPAPGTASARVTVLDVEEGPQAYVCVLRVDEVYAYGAAVPPLAPASELTAVVSQELLAAQQAPADSLLAPGTTLNLTLRHHRMMERGEAAAPPWRIIGFYK